MPIVLAAEQREQMHRGLAEILDRLPSELKDLEEAERQIQQGLRRLGEASMQAWAESADKGSPHQRAPSAGVRCGTTGLPGASWGAYMG